MLLSLIYLAAEPHIHWNTIHGHLSHIWKLLSTHIPHTWSHNHTRLSLTIVLLIDVLLLFLRISIVKTVKLINIKLLISCEHLTFFLIYNWHAYKKDEGENYLTYNILKHIIIN